MKPAYFDCHCDTLLETLRTGDSLPQSGHIPDAHDPCLQHGGAGGQG